MLKLIIIAFVLTFSIAQEIDMKEVNKLINYKKVKALVIAEKDLKFFLKQKEEKQKKIEEEVAILKKKVILSKKPIIKTIKLSSLKDFSLNVNDLHTYQPDKFKVILSNRDFLSLLRFYIYSIDEKLYLSALIKTQVLNGDFDNADIDFEFFKNDFKKNSVQTAKLVLGE